jgi:peptidoglycan/xylan/chitin deacetylase (PgdA/CDA1 family)
VSRFLTERGFAVEYPDGKPFAVCLTHDVDEIYPPREHILLSSLTSLGDFDLTAVRSQISWMFSGKEKSPYRTFKKIMDLEEKYGACSSFYFLATGSDILRFRYDIEDLENEVSQITDRGSEVGLHGGYYAYHDLGEILKEKKRLEKVAGKQIMGYRNHYLRFHVPDSWELLKRAGFLYDSTLGYNEAAGFRNGMCHPFHPYNLNTRSEIDILEIPLALMDCTLFESTQSFNDAWALAKRVIDTVISYRGVLCVNWHSNNFNCPFRKKWELLYDKLLDYCYHKNAWMTSGEQIHSWWEKNTW